MTPLAKIFKEAIRKKLPYNLNIRLKFISRLDFLFKETFKHLSRKQPKDSSAFLDTLPFCLKHTLFLETDMMGKMRTLSDIGQLFFITDDTKIKGNRAYFAGKYYDAIDAYE